MISAMRNRPPSTTAAPRCPLSEISTKWFVYQGQEYSVYAAPDCIIRKATEGLLEHDMTKQVARKSRLDTLSRWYVLCEARGLTLYASREEAMKEVSHANF
jgi:hypothetical protein